MTDRLPCPPHDFVNHWKLTYWTTLNKQYEGWAQCVECGARSGFRGRGGGVLGGVACCPKWPHQGIRDRLREREYDLVGEEAYA